MRIADRRIALRKVGKSFRPRLIVATYKYGATIAARVPSGIAGSFATVLGRVLAWKMRSRREQVVRHQRRISPGLQGEALKARTRAVFDSYARYWVSMFQLQGRSVGDVEAGIDVDGVERVDEALALGRGLIMAMPHIGAYDHGGSWVGLHWPITVVVERVEPPQLFEWFRAQRERTGMKIVPLGPDVASSLIAALRANEVVGLLCDRDIAGGGIEVDFFGERTTLPAGPATLSLRTGAPILPNAVYQRGHRVHGVIRPPIIYERTGKFRTDVSALTQLLATELEILIRAAPEQWHVLQPNWPSDHESSQLIQPVG